jgi:protein-S-isoprenylcysteine O-methyltransferase Ste14
MSLVPVWEIGVWNAWIFSVFTIFHISLMGAVIKDLNKKMDHGKQEETRLYLASVFWIIIIVYSIFAPFKLGTAWFYAGLALYLIGTLILTLFVTSVAVTPEGQPFTRSVYRFSRNPMYVGMILQFIGTAIATASWLLLVLTLLVTIALWSVIIIEERTCLERFGDAYRDYMARTSRWIGMPKSG